jgi:hypothetical protein
MKLIDNLNFFRFDTNKKIQIITILIIVAPILIVLDFFINIYTRNTSNFNTILKSEIVTIDATIENLLDEYGIKKEWKSKSTIQLSNELIRYEREINIPYNFPIVDLNYEINKICKKYNASTYSEEDIKNKIVHLKVIHSRLVIQNIRLVSDPNLLRIDGNIIALIKGIQEIGAVSKKFVLESPLYKIFLLDYRKNNFELIQLINKASKEYIIELNIKEVCKDEQFDFCLSMDSIAIYRKLRTILRDNEKAFGFFITYEKYDEVYNNILKNEISKMRKKMLLKRNVIPLTYEAGNFLNLSDGLYKELVNKGQSICTIHINEDNLNSVSELFLSIQKRGFRFEKISKIMN